MYDHRRIRVGLLLAAVLLGCGASWAADSAQERLQQIRARLRAEAGAQAQTGRDADLPLVAVTVLPGDTHRRLAADLTGSEEAAALLARIEPALEAGRQLFLPRALLAPRLGDPRLEPLQLDRSCATLWSLARTHTNTRGVGTAATVRTLQRLNHITDPTRMRAGETLLVPRSLLRAPPQPALPQLAIVGDYRVRDRAGLERVPRAEEFPRALREQLRRKGRWRRQLQEREVSLVVVHTTEHRGAPLANVAQYLQRKRLANYLIGRDGTVYEIVPEAYRSFGCGQSLWEGRYVVDHEAINIELLADTAPGEQRTGISGVQYTSLRTLISHIRARRPNIHPGRVLSHRMVAFSHTYGTRSRKGDPYEFDWARAGLPDNSQLIDQDVLLGRAKMCTDERYSDRVTPGQAAAERMQRTM